MSFKISQHYLVKAAQKGDVDSIHGIASRFGLDKGWLFQEWNKAGDTLMHFATRFGHVDLIRYLHEQQGVGLDSTNQDGKCALHEAVLGGHTQCVEYLLAQHVPVDCLKRADWTPLMLACTKGNANIIWLLLNHGADPALRNKDGWNAFHIASRQDRVGILKVLLAKDPECWKTTSKNGRTPLHTAALHGCEAVAQHLIQHCCYEPDCTDTCGTTPLMDAVHTGHTSTAQLLIAHHKADVTKSNSLGYQCLHLAAQSGSMAATRYLIEEIGIDPNVQSHAKVTPLHLAAKEGHCTVISLLLSHGANVTLADQMDRTALHYATNGQHHECVKLLLKRGADDKLDCTKTTLESTCLGCGRSTIVCTCQRHLWLS